jgi:transcriptional regulator with XRE-family HTH domain
VKASKFKPEPCSQCGAQRSVINGAWLREVRKSAGLTLREMARRVGMSAAYICDIERNRRNCLPAMRDAYEHLTSFGDGVKWLKPKP